jgi:hypothetical protein
MHFNRLDERTAFAVARLTANEDFRTLCEYLQGELDTRDKNNRLMDGPELHRSQGIAIALNEILTMAKTASTIARKIQATR